MEEFFEHISTRDIDLYRHRLHIVVSTNLLVSYKAHIPKGTRTQPIRAMHIVLDAQGNSMILLPFDAEPGEIAHECTHCMMHIIEEIGAGYGEEEFVCYLQGHLVELCHKALKDAKKAKKKKKELDIIVNV